MLVKIPSRKEEVSYTNSFKCERGLNLLTVVRLFPTLKRLGVQ
jgi:hypothetical protein